jgi:RpiB/LacA/LacB family sugar-phosphate isomerase
MQLALAADHAGYVMKDDLVAHLEREGHIVLDLGTNGPEPVDYPDFAEAVGQAILDGRADRGVIVCGSGIGASVAANKLRGIRAGLAHDTYSARQGVEHDDMNILVLGGRVIGPEIARELASTFGTAHFTGEERHLRRLAKVKALETQEHNSTKGTPT